MRLPPNRLIDWLPLLLFACSTPALAAQTWTTVWTPNNATPAKVVAKGGDHDSKTNCYPCKEWEDYGDGTGKWVDYDKGTEPTDCGDGTDYTCKECDGAGDVKDKDDGAPCVTDENKNGCCQKGECEPGSPINSVAELESCPTLVPKPNYTPSVSDPACGPAIGSIPALPSMFDSCCIDHDLCYGKCNSGKQTCDEELRLCMIDVADGFAEAGNFPAASIAYGCIEPTSSFFESGVISDDRYADGQVGGCYCCEEEAPDPWEDFPF